MTRTKRPRKNSSIKKELGRNMFHRGSISNDFKASLKPSDSLNVLLSRSYQSPNHFLEEFEKYYEEIHKTHHKRYKAAHDHVKKLYEETIKNLPETYQNTTIQSCIDENVSKVENKTLNSAASKIRPSRTCKPDAESLEFKRPKTPRINRSSSRNRSISAPPSMAPPPAPTNRFKTPSSSLRNLGPGAAIIPKVSDTPMCVMRRPEHGEVAFAASGSPLLVGRVSLEDVPTVTVPLQDGRIFSILPDPGAAPPNLPELDEETKRYLKALRQHLELLVP